MTDRSMHATAPLCPYTIWQAKFYGPCMQEHQGRARVWPLTLLGHAGPRLIGLLSSCFRGDKRFEEAALSVVLRKAPV